MWISALIVPLIATGILATTSTPASAIATAVPLGTAESFAVLAGASITNTGPSAITGDIGVSPGTSITGFPPGLVDGTQHSADAVALQAKSDLVAAYNDAAGQATDEALPPDAGGLTLVPGVYTASSGLGLTGTLTLDAQDNPDAVWVFQVGSTLTTASASEVSLINGASPCNVFWKIGSSATLGTSSTFVGNILALTSISATTGASIDGRALARTGSVTLDTNRITRPECEAGTTGTTTTGTTTGTTGTTTTGTTTGTTGTTTTGTTTGTTGTTTTGTTTGTTGTTTTGTTTGTTGTTTTGTTTGTTGTTTTGTTTGTTGTTTTGTTTGTTGTTTTGTTTGTTGTTTTGTTTGTTGTTTTGTTTGTTGTTTAGTTGATTSGTTGGGHGDKPCPCDHDHGHGQDQDQDEEHGHGHGKYSGIIGEKIGEKIGESRGHEEKVGEKSGDQFGGKFGGKFGGMGDKLGHGGHE
ncbi:ice-binding family protein [Streptomyces sp. 12257]|nr:ice-binding family protein [Streptomyces sp. 12257]MDI5912948.1 ice-binding family protein [Streptomyces sp. 12257]